MEYQQPRGYTWPQSQPPPPGSDPYQRPPVPPPPHVPPPPGSQPWPYPATQFQFQHQTQHSPSPPPPQWPIPPYPVHQPMHHLPYPPHPPHYPQMHQFPPRPQQAPHSYLQDSGAGRWSRPQYATNSNEEDWEAKARAWAAAKSATDKQLPPPHSQPHDPQHLEMHKPTGSAPNYQQYQSQGQMQVSQLGTSGESNYAPDVPAPFSSMDGSIAGGSASQPLEEKASSIPFVHQQEVPSSYSSLAGTGEGFNNGSSSVPFSSHPHHYTQQQQSADGRPGWVEQSPHVFSGRPDSVSDPSNQPLNFTPHFSHIRDPHVPPSHALPSGGTVGVTDPSFGMGANFAWPPAPAAGPLYAPVPPPIVPVAQGDPIAVPPPSGPSAPIFPAGHGVQPTVPMAMIGAAFGATPAVLPHHTSFSGDAYGVPERPKKASVPNWLREEIIKKKASLATSGPDIPKVDSPSFEADGNDAYYRSRDQADSKSIDSVEEEDDDDEVEMEAARTAALNQEIKRVLTEVLLKVTDELFDEIASKVLTEDDVSSEARPDAGSPKHQSVPSTPSISTTKASAKVLFPANSKGIAYEDVHEKSNSSSPEDVLGLASYASDDEDDESTSKLNQPELSSGKISENSLNVENGSFNEMKVEGTDSARVDAEKAPIFAKKDQSSGITKLKDPVEDDHSAPVGDPTFSGRQPGDYIDESQFSKLPTNKAAERNAGCRDDSQLKSSLIRSVESQDIKNFKKDDFEGQKEVIRNKGDDEHVGRDEKSERINYNDSPRGREKAKGRTDEKVINSGSRSSHDRQPSPYSGREERTDIRSKKRGYRDDKCEKWPDRSVEEKNEHGRHRSGSKTSRHDQRRSSPVGSRGRESESNSKMSHLNDSSDESAGYSRRKSYHSRRDRSPSPIRSRKRQSKRSHSPFSSPSTRRTRSQSRSKSPRRSRRR